MSSQPREAPTAIRPPASTSSDYSTETASTPTIRDDTRQTIARGLSEAQRTEPAALSGDARLLQLAEWLAPQLGSRGELPDYSGIQRAMRHLGLIDPEMRAIVVGATPNEDPAAQIATNLRELLASGDYTHVAGLATRRDDLRIYLLVLTTRRVRMQPVPRFLPRPGFIQVAGKALHGLTTPSALVTLPNGMVFETMKGAGADFDYTLNAATPGTYEVEVLASSGKGRQESVARLTIYVEKPAPDVIGYASPERAPASTAEAAKLLLDRTNAERSKAGLPLLSVDPALGRQAELELSAWIGGGMQASWTPETLRSGNRAFGYSFRELYTNIMDTPSTRRHMMDASSTKVGIALRELSQQPAAGWAMCEVFQ